MQGRSNWAKRNAEALVRAIEYFDTAIAEDSSYALAWSGRADAYAILPYYHYGHRLSRDAPDSAIVAAERAFGLDSTIAETSVSLAFVRWEYDWDWEEAERLFRRALDLNGTYAAAHAWYGSFLVAKGRLVEGIEHIRQAIRLDPWEGNWHGNLGHALQIAGRHAEAVGPFLRRLELSGRGALDVAALFQRLGRREEAEQRFQAALDNGDTTVAILLHFGDTTSAISLLERHRRSFDAGDYSPVLLARRYLDLGRTDEALEMLEIAADRRDPRLAWYDLRLGDLPTLANEPRFKEVLRRIGLEEH